MEVVHGTGNVFRDLGLPNPDTEQLLSLLACGIIRALDAQKLTVRAAQAMTGVAAADFSRIRNARLGQFTVDRLMTILAGLGQDVAVSVSVVPRVGVAGDVADAARAA
jgi:predicted XRE-type DNA-binding protein